MAATFATLNSFVSDRHPSSRLRLPSWLIAAAALGAWLLFFWASRSQENWGRINGWFLWPIWPMFGDLHGIWTGCAAWQRGIDPLVPGDYPLYNYPRAWLLLSYLGVHRLPVVACGLALDAAALATIVVWLRPARAWPAALGAFLLFSPPLRFVLERANVDLVMLLLLTAAAFAAARSARRGLAWLAPSLLLIGTLLKLYPLAALALGAALGWTQPRHRRWWIGAVALTVLLLALQHDDLRVVAAKSPQPDRASFGLTVVGFRFFGHVYGAESPAFAHLTPSIWAVSLVTYSALILAALHRGCARRSHVAQASESDHRWHGYWIGTAVYAGCFLLGGNYLYRLVLLFLPLPLLLELASDRSHAAARWARLTLAMLAAVMFAPLVPVRVLFAATQVCQWSLAVLLIYGAAVLAPALPAALTRWPALRRSTALAGTATSRGGSPAGPIHLL